MRFAVASQNYRTVTPHAGKTRRFLLFDAVSGSPPVECGRLDLPPDMTLHAFTGGPHPLDMIDVVIAGSAGTGVVARLREHGVIALSTTETDPSIAVSAFLDGTLPPGGGHDGCACG